MWRPRSSHRRKGAWQLHVMALLLSVQLCSGPTSMSSSLSAPPSAAPGPEGTSEFASASAPPLPPHCRCLPGPQICRRLILRLLQVESKVATIVTWAARPRQDLDGRNSHAHARHRLVCSKYSPGGTSPRKPYRCSRFAAASGPKHSNPFTSDSLHNSQQLGARTETRLDSRWGNSHTQKCCQQA